MEEGRARVRRRLEEHGGQPSEDSVDAVGAVGGAAELAAGPSTSRLTNESCKARAGGWWAASKAAWSEAVREAAVRPYGSRSSPLGLR